MISFRSSVSPAKGRVGRTLVINLSFIGIAAAALLLVVLALIIRNSFATLEESELHGHLSRAENFQQRALRTLDAKTKDWAVWDETYQFGQDFNPHYVASNVSADAFQNAIIDGMAVYRYADGEVRSFSFDRGTGSRRPQVAAALGKIVASPAFATQVETRKNAQGYVTIDGRLYALAANQLRRSGGEGKQVGFLAFIQELDSSRASEVLQVHALIDAGERPGTTIIDRTGDTVDVTMPVRGIDGDTVAALKLDLPRPLRAASRDLLTLTFGGVMLLIIAMLLTLKLRIKALILDPVERLHTHVESIRGTGELRSLEDPMPSNEFGALRDEFNQMATELQGLRAELESQSFTLGKTQSAVGLTHNLRNCLSPVRVILESLERDAAAPLPPQVPQALDELADETLPRERREKLLAFLNAAHCDANERAARQRQALREAARGLMGGLAAIDATESDRSAIRFDEPCNLAALLGHSANIARYADGPAVQVAIDCGNHWLVRGNRVLLSQILENLVTNALEAIRETATEEGVILLRAILEGERCRITISDNGGGFPREEAARLFDRGYSTRTSKSGGMGLHWCANTVRAMDGELSMESPGPGLGARAILVLPLWSEAQNTVSKVA